jgi:hypothetical protein
MMVFNHLKSPLKKRGQRGGRMAEVMERLPSKSGDQSSNPSTTKKIRLNRTAQPKPTGEMHNRTR